MHPRARLAAVAAVGLLLGLGWASYAGYVKDDAFISLRYARNLLAGRGMVFNEGEAVEGYTNFLWVLLAVPALAARVDPIVWLKVLGAVSAAGVAAVLFALGRPRGPETLPAPLRAAIGPALWASSTSVALWSMSGLEGCFVALLSVGAFFALHRALERGELRGVAVASLLWAAATLTRPEGHALFALALPFALVRAARAGKLRAVALALVVPWAAIVAPYHLWRLATFGDLLPNTYYVKASAGAEVLGEGVRTLGRFLAFGAQGPLLALAVLATLPRGDRLRRLHALAVVVFFLAYLVRIGRDEMKHFRLLLPALPLLTWLAAEGVVLVATRARRSALVAAALTAALVAPGLGYTLTHRREAGYLAMSARSLQALGRTLEASARPGDACLFQDMGAAPWSAPSVTFVDTVGILDRTVARTLAAARLNPFLRDVRAARPGGPAELAALDARLRDYLLGRHTRWAAFVGGIGPRERARFARRFADTAGDARRTERLLHPALAANWHAHGLLDDARFRRRYRFVRAWQRNTGYYVALYETVASP